MKTSTEVCLKNGCKRHVRTRGLCASCFTINWRLVKQGKVTWDELERDGLVGQAKRPGQLGLKPNRPKQSRLDKMSFVELVREAYKHIPLSKGEEY